MRVLSLHAPAACRLAAGRRNSASRSQQRVLVTRAEQGSGAAVGSAPVQAPPAAAAVAAEAAQQAAPAVDVQAMAEQVQAEETAAQAVSHASQGHAAAPAEQQSAVAAQVVPSAPSPAAAAGRSLPFGLSLEHPGVKIAGISAGVFLGGTLLLTLFRMGRDPQRKRSKTINKNKVCGAGGCWCRLLLLGVGGG